jgi:hypothetical protein
MIPITPKLTFNGDRITTRYQLSSNLNPLSNFLVREVPIRLECVEPGFVINRSLAPEIIKVVGTVGAGHDLHGEVVSGAGDCGDGLGDCGWGVCVWLRDVC